MSLESLRSVGGWNKCEQPARLPSAAGAFEAMTTPAKDFKVTPVGDCKFSVEGRSLICARCEYRADAEKHVVGNACPKCGGDGGVLKRAEHLVDVSEYSGFGLCTCGRWTFSIQPKLTRMSPAERRAARGRDDLRCDHIRAALQFMVTWKRPAVATSDNGFTEPQPVTPGLLACSRCGEKFEPELPSIPDGTSPALAAALRRLFTAKPACPRCVATARPEIKKISPARVSRPLHSPTETQGTYRMPYPD